MFTSLHGPAGACIHVMTCIIIIIIIYIPSKAIKYIKLSGQLTLVGKGTKLSIQATAINLILGSVLKIEFYTISNL